MQVHLKDKKQDGNYFDSFIGLDFFMTKEIKNMKQLVVFSVIIVLVCRFLVIPTHLQTL